jgi:hypothetical protein
MIFVFVQKLRKFNPVILFIVIRFEADFFAEQKHDIFLNKRAGAVNLKGVILKREAAAVVSFAGVSGGKQGIKVEIRGDRRKGGFLLASRLPVETPVELPDETREGGVGLLHCGNAVQGEPNGQAALQRFPEALDTPVGLRASGR